MPDRADYLAHMLLKRREDLEATLLDDAAPDEFEQNQRRQEMVAKVLAVDAGVIDHVLVQIVLAAMPRVIVGEAVAEGDRLRFAGFLRRTIPLE